MAALRVTRMAGLAEADAVVLETDGSLSVVAHGRAAGRLSLDDVRSNGDLAAVDGSSPPRPVDGR